MMTELFFLIFIAVFVAAVAVPIIVTVVQNKKKNSDPTTTTQYTRTSSHTNNSKSHHTASTNNTTVRSTVKPIQPTVKPLQETTHTHVDNTILSNNDGHRHTGADHEEYYDTIVGSLGDVSDEGCDDLDGVRLIAHDLMYDTTEQDKDYSQLIKALVLGEILNEPRFKKPYHRK